MGSDPDREPPFFFCKPADAVVAAQGSGLLLPFPSATANLHYEVEQARRVRACACLAGRSGAPRAGGGAQPRRSGHCRQRRHGLRLRLRRRRGLHAARHAGTGTAAAPCSRAALTRLRTQDEAKRTKRPWDMSKACLLAGARAAFCSSCLTHDALQGFDNSGPVSALVPVRPRERWLDCLRRPEAPLPRRLRACVIRSAAPSGAIAACAESMRSAWLRRARRRLSINGAVKQRSDLSHHIWTVPETVRTASVRCPAALTPRALLRPAAVPIRSRTCRAWWHWRPATCFSWARPRAWALWCAAMCWRPLSTGASLSRGRAAST